MFLIHLLIYLDLNNFVYQMKLNADLQRDNLIQMDTNLYLNLTKSMFLIHFPIHVDHNNLLQLFCLPDETECRPPKRQPYTNGHTL